MLEDATTSKSCQQLHLVQRLCLTYMEISTAVGRRGYTVPGAELDIVSLRDGAALPDESIESNLVVQIQ